VADSVADRLSQARCRSGPRIPPPAHRASRGAGRSGPEPKAPIRYQAMSTVPEHWIPFISVHVDQSVRETQLQRAALPRILEGDPNPPEKVRPRTTLLRFGLPQAYFVHEEEVPRAGVLVTQRYQRARWRHSSVWVWFGARKQTGRGEGSSGLRFDTIEPAGTL